MDRDMGVVVDFPVVRPSDAGLGDHIPDGSAQWDLCPWSETLSDYDRSHIVTYVRLLRAEWDDLSERDIGRVVLGLDFKRDPVRASAIVRSHLVRAHWIAETLAAVLEW